MKWHWTELPCKEKCNKIFITKSYPCIRKSLFTLKHSKWNLYILMAQIQGVQDQNLPKEIGITKKLCTSDP